MRMSQITEVCDDIRADVFARLDNVPDIDLDEAGALAAGVDKYVQCRLIAVHLEPPPDYPTG